MINPIYPCLWFDGNAKEAAEFYCRVFPHSEIIQENEMVVVFESSGQKFMCLNGGPDFKFTPSISIYTILESEVEIQHVWDQLIDGGKALMELDSYEWSSQYGWVQDKFGVSWQLTVSEPENSAQKFIPAFMFTGENFGKAKTAMEFYMSLFPDSSLSLLAKYPESDQKQAGKVMHSQFKINNQLFVAMDSGFEHGFNFTPALSLVIECEDQKEIDFYWTQLSQGGREDRCGWLQDQFGVSWQVVPKVLSKLLMDPERSQRVVEAFMKMKKFDIEKLMEA